MAKQRETVAYGHPDFGGIVFGGERPNKDYSLEQWDFTEDDESYKITVTFYVYGDDKADFVSKIRALEAGARNSGNIAITSGVSVTRTVDITSAAQVVTITRTTGAVFTSFDLGMPIDLEGVGTFQITRFVSGSVVEARVVDGLTVPANASGLTATIGHTHFAAVDDPDKDIYLARAEIDRSPDGDDDDLRRRFIFTVTAGKPASKARASGFGNRKKAFYKVSTGGDGLKSITFRGVYTAGDGENALAAYNNATTGFQAWVATVTAAFVGTTGPFEIEGKDSFEVDDEEGLLSFGGTRRQVNFPETATEVNSGLISGTQVRFTRSLDLVHGLPNIHKPYLVQLSYSTQVDAAQTPYEDILALWRSTIKPHLLNEAANIFGTVLVILNETSPAIDAANNRLGAGMTVLVSKSGSSIYQYRKTVTYDFDEKITDDDLHDGLPNTYASWTPQANTSASVIVAITQLGQPQGGQGVRGSGGGLFSGFGFGGISGGISGGLGLFGGGKEPLAISFEPGGGAKRDDKATGPEKYPTPGDPNLILDNLPGPGQWSLRRRRARVIPEFWGEDPEKIGASIDVSFSVYTSIFRWINPGDSRTDPSRIPTKPIRRRGLESVQQEPKRAA